MDPLTKLTAAATRTNSQQFAVPPGTFRDLAGLPGASPRMAELARRAALGDQVILTRAEVEGLEHGNKSQASKSADRQAKLPAQADDRDS